MKFTAQFGWVAGVLMLTSLWSCDETFELNAPYEDIYAVYGILDPEADTQFVRISLGFQPESDALEVASTYNGAVGDLEVMLKGNGLEIPGVFIDNILKNDNGDFGDTTGAYRFGTAGDEALINGEVYILEIRKPDDPEFFLSARTRIPEEPRIISPSRIASQGEFCLPTVDVEDTVNVLIRKNDRYDNLTSHFEVRWLLRYEQEGQRFELTSKPSRIFSANVRCSRAGSGNICYATGNGTVLKDWQQAIPTEAEGLPVEVRCSQIPIELTRNAEIQVTALDSILAKYVLANDPAFLNLNTIRREFTNVTGTARAVGIFGSIAYDNEPFLLTPCAEFTLGLSQQTATCN